MARPVSCLESHPQRQKIIDDLVSGKTYRQVARQTDPPISTAAISRFASRIKRDTAASIRAAKNAIAHNDMGLGADVNQAVTRAAALVASDPFLSRAIKSDARRERWMKSAESEADYRALAALDRNDLSAQEYQARLTGRLEAPATGTTIVYVTMAPAVAPPTAPVQADWTVAPDGSSVPNS
jgi:hypothetical protein